MKRSWCLLKLACGLTRLAARLARSGVATADLRSAERLTAVSGRLEGLAFGIRECGYLRETELGYGEQR